MKFVIKAVTCLLVCVAFSLGTATSSKACDRTNHVLDSIVVNPGGTFTIYTSFCIGGGVTGGLQGADNSTIQFAFGIWGDPTMNLVGFSPSSYTSDSTGCSTGPATNAGPIPTPGDPTIHTIFFNTPCLFQCVNSVAACGQAHAFCAQIQITTDVLPDSIRLFGAEGSGNPYAGCYPNPDMVVDLSDTILPVTWASFEAIPKQNSVDLRWTTASEHNNDYFQVMKLLESGWETIEVVDGAGNSDQAISYSYEDFSPQYGLNQYRIVQVDFDGASSTSTIRSVVFDGQEKFGWHNVGPVPTNNFIQYSFWMENEQNVEVQLVDITGKVIRTDRFLDQRGLNNHEIDLSGEAEGIYFLRVNSAQGTLNKKVIKI